MTPKEIVTEIVKLDRLASHGIKTLNVIHLDKYRSNREKRKGYLNLLKQKGYK